MAEQNLSKEPKKTILSKSEFYKNLRNYSLNEILKLDNPDTNSCLFTKLEMLYALLKYKEKENCSLTIEQLNKKLQKNVAIKLYKKIKEYNNIRYTSNTTGNNPVAKIDKNIIFKDYYQIVKKNKYFIPIINSLKKKKLNINKNNTYLIKLINNFKIKIKDEYEKILIDELYNIIIHYDFLYFNNSGQEQKVEIYKERSSYVDINYIYMKYNYNDIIYRVRLTNCIKIESKKTIAWPWKYYSKNSKNHYYNPFTNQTITTLPSEKIPICILEIIDKIYELLKDKCIMLYNLINKYKYINYVENEQNIRSKIMHIKNTTNNPEIEYRYFIFYDYIEKKFIIPIQDKKNKKEKKKEKIKENKENKENKESKESKQKNIFKKIYLDKCISFQKVDRNTNQIITKEKLFEFKSFEDTKCNIVNNNMKYLKHNNENNYKNNENYYSRINTNSSNESQFLEESQNNTNNSYILDLLDKLYLNPDNYENIIGEYEKSLSTVNHIFKIIYEINKSNIAEEIKNKIIIYLKDKRSKFSNYTRYSAKYYYYINFVLDDLIKRLYDYENIIEKFKLLINSTKSTEIFIKHIVKSFKTNETYNEEKKQSTIRFLIETNIYQKIMNDLKKNPDNFVSILDLNEKSLTKIIIYCLMYNIYIHSNLDIELKHKIIYKLFINNKIDNDQNFFHEYALFLIRDFLKNINSAPNQSESLQFNTIFDNFKDFITYYYSINYKKYINEESYLDFQKEIVDQYIKNVSNQNFLNQFNTIAENTKTTLEKKLKTAFTTLRDDLPKIFNNITINLNNERCELKNLYVSLDLELNNILELNNKNISIAKKLEKLKSLKFVLLESELNNIIMNNESNKNFINKFIKLYETYDTLTYKTYKNNEPITLKASILKDSKNPNFLIHDIKLNNSEIKFIKSKIFINGVYHIPIKFNRKPMFIPVADCIKLSKDIDLGLEWPFKKKHNEATHKDYYLNPNKLDKFWKGAKGRDPPNENFPIKIRDIIENIYKLVKLKCLELNSILNNFKTVNISSKEDNFKKIAKISNSSVENSEYITYYDFLKKEFTIPYKDNEDDKKISKIKLSKSMKMTNIKSNQVENITFSNNLFDLKSMNTYKCN